MKKLIISFILIGLLIFSANPEARAGEMTPELQSAIQFRSPDEEISVIITLSDKVDSTRFKDSDKHLRRSKLINALRGKADSTQKPLKVFLEGRGVKRLRSLWVINGMAVTVKAKWLRALENYPGVESIRLDDVLNVPETSYSSAAVPEWNLNTIRALEIWNSGYTGEGVVIAGMDTGVDNKHPDLSSNWRGGTNSWFDPYNQHGTPYDTSGHGTQTMGVIVGGSNGGTAIGVAPGAKWIAVKIFNDTGAASFSGIHLGFQWLLDPDGDPATDDAPDVVNNSWGLESNYGSCIREFENDIRTLKAANIAVVFSAGNGGPGLFSSLSPANYTDSFSVGAIDINNIISGFSSKGPSACDGSVYPGVVAPGVSIRTSDLTFGGVFPNSYTTVSGTSFAASHIAGTMALLLSAFPGLQVQDLEAAMKASASDLGAAGIDNDYGNGLVNAVNAYNYLSGVIIDTCTPGTPAIEATSEGETCSDGIDNDCDNAIDTNDTDCNTDLVVISVSDPPVRKKRGGSFKVKDVVMNRGATSVQSVTRYYLSKDTVKSKRDILLKGKRIVQPLTINIISEELIPTKVTIPAGTPAHKYYVIACADVGNKVTETDETNNCTASFGIIKVRE